MADGKFSSTVSALFQGMEAFLTTKTVVGEAVKFDDGTIILPLVDVSFGMGAGSLVNGPKDSSGGGMSGKMTPSAVLVIQNGHARLVNVKNQDALTKIFDMVPDLVDKFTKDSATKEQEKEVDERAAQLARGQEKSEP